MSMKVKFFDFDKQNRCLTKAVYEIVNIFLLGIFFYCSKREFCFIHNHL